MKSPLEGLRVVELARILAGPFAGQTLADLELKLLRLKLQTVMTLEVGGRRL